MAKVQGKKAAGSAKKSAAKKPAARSAKAVAASGRVKPAAKKAPAKPAAKKTATKPIGKKTSAKPVAKKQAPGKAAAEAAPKKPTAKAAPKKPAAKGAGKPAAKAVSSKEVKKVAPKVAAKPASALKVARVAPKAEAKPTPKPAAKVLARPAKAEAPAKAPVPAVAQARTSAKAAADSDKKRARRSRPRVQSNGAPVAAWLNAAEKPRPSSFIPAPARAEAPSLVAAPPASSDRLIRSEDLTDLALRTVPVRVDIEQGGGRVYLGINPEELMLHVGEGIEWDFRYFGGADVTVDEVVIEFDKPSPFTQTSFRSHKPGTARPHRQHSGAAQPSAAGKHFRYAIRAMTSFRTELAVTHPFVNVVGS